MVSLIKSSNICQSMTKRKQVNYNNLDQCLIGTFIWLQNVGINKTIDWLTALLCFGDIGWPTQVHPQTSLGVYNNNVLSHRTDKGTHTLNLSTLLPILCLNKILKTNSNGQTSVVHVVTQTIIVESVNQNLRDWTYMMDNSYQTTLLHMMKSLTVLASCTYMRIHRRTTYMYTHIVYNYIVTMISP